MVTVTTGFSTPDVGLSNAFLYALSSNLVVCYSVPDVDGNLDSTLTDYPYAWNFSNVLPVSSTDRKAGQHSSPSATGTNCVAAPGRNIVAAVTYSSGTSWSCPIVAGLMALLIQRFPNQTAAAYVSDFQNTKNPFTLEVNGVTALNTPVPVMTIQLHGLAGWNYETQSSTNLTDWLVGTNLPLNLSQAFFRGKVE